MVKEKYIEKNDPASPELTFLKLKEEGIRILQELAGNKWTDYNTHDPGVTILEQLCYALTELIYKSGFSVADYLVDRDGSFDYDRLALFSPKDIYPAIPVTVNDHRKLLFDYSDSLVDIWISPSKRKDYSGLYSILVQPRNRYLNDRNKTRQIIEATRQSFCANRNLGEDLDEIRVARVKNLGLVADIEINHSQEPEIIMAEIYFQVSKFLNPGITYHSFEEMAAGGMPADEILTGPLLKHGWINDREMIPVRSTVFCTDLMQVIDKIEGVISVSKLFIMAGGRQYSDECTMEADDMIPVLIFPETPEEIKVTLRKDYRTIKVIITKMQGIYWKLVSQRWAVYNAVQDPDSLFSFPKGNFQEFREYHSIQHQFPLNYGINEFGVAESETPRRKYQAKQLKAYLLVFEQLLANYLEQITHIKDLYSVDASVDQTYFSQPLDNVPGGVGDLYISGSRRKEEVRKLTSCSNTHNDRRNRFLDYLLSLYGEDFKQKALKRYNYYHEGSQLDQALIDNKIAFLRSLITINKNRSKSFNYLKTSWNTENISGLKYKSLVLLGIRNVQQVSYSDTFLKWGFRLVSEVPSDPALGYVADTDLANIVVNKEYIETHFIPVPLLEVDHTYNYEETRELITSIELFRNNTIPDTFLRYGVSLGNYRIGTYEDSKNVIAVFHHPVNNEWNYVSSFKDLRSARIQINKTRKFLILLNRDSEGLHIVEHILLRPMTGTANFTFGITGRDGNELFTYPQTISFDERENLLKNIISHLNGPDLFEVGTKTDDVYVIRLILTAEEVMESNLTYNNEASAFEAMEELRTHMGKLIKEGNTGILFTKNSLRGNGVRIPDDFYSQRISVIFPDWTSRFNNEKFRMLAEETVSGNAPAHIFPEYYWLNPEKMEQFEMLYRAWLEEKLKGGVEQLEITAVNLISFLLNHQRSGNIYT